MLITKTTQYESINMNNVDLNLDLEEGSAAVVNPGQDTLCITMWAGAARGSLPRILFRQTTQIRK